MRNLVRKVVVVFHVNPKRKQAPTQKNAGETGNEGKAVWLIKKQGNKEGNHSNAPPGGIQPGKKSESSREKIASKNFMRD